MRISDWSSDVCSSDLLSGAQHAALQDAGARIGVLWSANFSLGVALLEELVERAAGARAGWACDIVVMHHTRKLDQTSGPAQARGAAAGKSGQGGGRESVWTYG